MRQFLVNSALIFILGGCSFLNGLSPLATYSVDYEVADLIVSNNQGYVNTGRDGLLIILDISNPLTPIKIGEFNLSKGIEAVTINKDYVYVVTFDNQLRILDVSDPSYPVEVGSYQVQSQIPILDIVVLGHYAYLANREDGLRIVDISDPTTPEIRGRFKLEDKPALSSFPAQIDKVYIVNKYLYVAGTITKVNNEGQPGMIPTTWILDINDPNTPILVQELDYIQGIKDIVIKGDMAYVVDGWKFSILDISNPKDPKLLGRYDTPFIPRGVGVIGKYAIIADTDSLRVIDVSNPADMVEVTSYNATYVEEVDRVKNLIYAIDDDPSFKQQISIFEFEDTTMVQ